MAIPHYQREGILFYLPSSTNVSFESSRPVLAIWWNVDTFIFILQDDFVALEMFDRKIRFIWNVGGGTGVVTHPEILDAGNPDEDRSWYRIEAER